MLKGLNTIFVLGSSPTDENCSINLSSLLQRVGEEGGRRGRGGRGEGRRRGREEGKGWERRGREEREGVEGGRNERRERERVYSIVIIIRNVIHREWINKCVLDIIL